MKLGSIFLLFSKLLQCQVFGIEGYKGAVVFGVDETDLEYTGKDLYIQAENKEEKKATFYNRKKQKVFRYATLVVIQEGERPLTIAFLPVLLGQKRKDTMATLLKFVRGCT